MSAHLLAFLSERGSFPATGASAPILSTFGPFWRRKTSHFNGDLGPVLVDFWAVRDPWADGVDLDAFDGSGLSVQIFMTGGSAPILATFGHFWSLLVNIWSLKILLQFSFYKQFQPNFQRNLNPKGTFKGE